MAKANGHLIGYHLKATQTVTLSCINEFWSWTHHKRVLYFSTPEHMHLPCIQYLQELHGDWIIMDVSDPGTRIAFYHGDVLIDADRGWGLGRGIWYDGELYPCSRQT